MVTRFSAAAASVKHREPAVDISASSSTKKVSFSDFYDDHHDSIARALAVTLGDSDLASDATSEAMTRAYKRWSKISGYDKPAAWVYRVGLNWSLSWRQRRRREWHRPVTFGPDTDRLMSRDNSMDAALDALSVDHRAVVVCRIHLDWSVEQTAEALGIAPGTVKSRLARALSQLKPAAVRQGHRPTTADPTTTNSTPETIAKDER